MRARMPGLNRVSLTRPTGRFGGPSRQQVQSMEAAIRRRHGPNLARRQRAAARAYTNRPWQRASRAMNRGLWNVRNRLTPQTLTGKLKLGAGLSAAGLGGLGLLGGLLGGLVSKESKKQKGSGLKKSWVKARMFATPF